MIDWLSTLFLFDSSSDSFSRADIRGAHDDILTVSSSSFYLGSLYFLGELERGRGKGTSSTGGGSWKLE